MSKRKLEEDAAPPKDFFRGLRVLVCLQSTGQRKAQSDLVLKRGGAIAEDAASATHMVLEAVRNPASQPALAKLSQESWPLLHTEKWISACSKGLLADPTNTTLLSSEAHPARPPPPPAAAASALRFGVGNHYLNLLPGEARTPRHVCYEDLVPRDCELALFTSLDFGDDGAYRWLRESSPSIPRALLIIDRCPKAPPESAAPVLSERGSGWFVLEGQRSAGIVHCSLLLFRAGDFLRVVVAGTNLEGQLLRDRDSLYVQDFPVLPGARTSSSPSFGARLETFLRYLPFQGLPQDHSRVVREHCARVLADVDFGSATGALVTCMPGGSASLDKGGWQELRRALAEICAPRTDGRIDIATGHFGAIQLDFLAQMARTLRRAPPGGGGEWDSIGRCFMYHSSRDTVLAPLTNSFAVMRTTAPGAATHARLLSHFFHDSVPKFERADPDALAPILHGKAMLATSADGTHGVMFVGSQNFSKASWGEGNAQPSNVEIGVVLKADTADGVRELRERFPVQLAPDEHFGSSAEDRGYVMARGPTNGDNSTRGLQMTWRKRCNDLSWLAEWRRHLHGWWNLGWPME